MITQLYLSQLAKIIHGELHGSDRCFKKVGIDTRKLEAGSLFFAIKGKNFDGHEFLAQAEQAGAVGFIVEKPVSTSLPYILVNSVREALGYLARYLRDTYPIPTIAITGSNGKTTTRCILESIMSLKGSVLATIGSMNNDIGLPLTIFRQASEHDYAILELGTNHFGEISYLTKIAQPDIAAITLIGPAHLESLGDLEGVKHAKGEIFEGLKPGGTAILNADQPEYLEYFSDLVAKRANIITFGRNLHATVRAENIKLHKDGCPSFDLVINQERRKVKMCLLGEHNVHNALAAAACAYAAGVSISFIVKGIENARTVQQRLVRREGLNGSIVIDDSYSAIPNAVLAAIDVLALETGIKIFAFGGMAELGANPEQYYVQIGEYARIKGIDYLYVCDPLGHFAVKAFGENGLQFDDSKIFVNAIKSKLAPGVSVLLKARRSFRMEDIVAQLLPTETV